MTWLADRQPTHGDRAMHGVESVAPNLWRGLVGAWSPELGVTGATIFDTTGRGNDGLYLGATLATDWVRSHDGRWCLKAQGTSGRVELSDITLTDYTLSIWGNYTTSGNRSLVACDNHTATPRNAFIVKPANATCIFEAHVAGTGGTIDTGITPSASEWHLYTQTRQGTSAVGYIDGVERGSGVTVGSGSFATPNLRLGCHYHSGSNREFFAGFFGESLIYNRALAASEIAQLYELARGGIYHKRITRVKSSAVVPAVAVGHGLSGLEFGTTYDAGTIAPTGPQHIEAGITV